MKGLKYVLLSAALVTAALLVSCYQPLTERLIAAIEDDFNPVIIIDTPTNGDTYYSTIDVTGRINDDSISAGDNRGLLRSFSFIVSNDLDHKGKIDLDSEGNSVKDSSFGNLDIIYDNSNRSFSFSVPTSDLGYPPQTLYVLISVVDFNGNVSTEVISLIRSEGPFIDLTQPLIDTYYQDETITIQGTVSDSIRQLDQAGEVATIKLEILALGISTELDIAGGDTSVPLITRGGTFDYDPGLRTFQTFLYLDSASTFDENITTMVLNLLATDLTGNVTTISRTMTLGVDSGPILNTSSPRLTGTYFYSGSGPASPILWVDGTTRIASSSLTVGGSMFYPFTNRRIATAELQFGAGTIDLKSHADTTHYGPDENPLSGYWHPFDYYFYNIVYPESMIRSFIGDGIVNLTLTAIDDTPELRTSIQQWQLKEDSAGPLFSLETAGTDSSNSYVGDAHTVFLSFQINDGAFETGVELALLRGTVGNITYIASDFGVTEVLPIGSGVYDITLNIPLSTPPKPPTGMLQISISADDYIGNTTTIDQDKFDQLITYYPGAPSLPTRTVVSENVERYATSTDILTVSIISDHDLDHGPTVDIGGNVVVASGSDKSWTATTVAPADGEGPVSLEFSDIVNKANEPSLPATVSGVTAGNLVVFYPGKPTLYDVEMTLERAGVPTADPPAKDDVIVLAFKVDGLVDDRNLQSDPTVAFMSGATTLTLTKESGSPTATDYRYTHTVTTADLSLVDPIAYTIDFTDAAGTAGDQVSATSTVDLTPP